MELGNLSEMGNVGGVVSFGWNGGNLVGMGKCLEWINVWNAVIWVEWCKLCGMG